MLRRRRSDRFLAALAPYSQAVVITHNTPDPDAVASGWALCQLIERKLGIAVRLVAGGAVVRAENRRMLELLDPPLELVRTLHVDKNTALVFVDCLPAAAAQLLENGEHTVAAIIDHHEGPNGHARATYRDIRPKVVAAGTLATQYLREQAIEPEPDLATALVYAIQTDARSAATTPSRLDKTAVAWLIPRADLKKLAEIANAPLEPAYFTDLVTAIGSTLVYGNAALCVLPSAHGPETIGEFADLLIRCRTIDRVLCAALYDSDVLLSVRTTRDGGDACGLVRQTLAGLGSGGGHQHRAGGNIPDAVQRFAGTDGWRAELCRRWLAACGADPQKETPLVADERIQVLSCRSVV